jgi:hypothetical protein
VTTAAIVPPLPQAARADTRSGEVALWSVLVLITAACVVLHLGRILTYLFPFMIFVMAIVFQRKSPSAYVRLLIISLVFTPFVRRLADWASSYTDPSPLLVAPLLAPFASLLSIRYRDLLRPRELPFVLAGIGILYGLAIGLLSNHISLSIFISFMRWSNPLVWGLYVVQKQDERSGLSETLVTTLRWATLICAIYGLIQVVSPLPWDTLWLKSQLENSGTASFGTDASAFGFRLFSTLNSCGVAAPILGIGTIAWLASSSKFRFVALVLLVAGVFLTMVRTEWLCLPVSIVLLAILAGKHRAPIVRAVLFAGIALALVASTVGAAEPDMMGKLTERLTGFGQGSKDQSYSARTTAMAQGLRMLLHMPFGAGLGFLDTPAYDATPMSFSSGAAGGDLALVGMFFDLGYVGAIAYSLGVCMVLVSMFRHRARDKMTSAMLITIAVSTVLHFWSNIPFVAPEAFFFWASAALVDGI